MRLCVAACVCVRLRALCASVCVCVYLRGRRRLPRLTKRVFITGICFFFSLVHAGQIFVDFSRIMFMCLVFVRRLGLSFVFLASALSYFRVVCLG